MRLQIVSDLHLETLVRAPAIEVVAPYLALLGDIGDPDSASYAQLLAWASKHYEKVFVILGNHEYWGKSPAQTQQCVTRLTLIFPNVFFLDRTMHDMEDKICILGCTLWTHVPVQDIQDAACYVKDYTFIKGGWSVQENNAAHNNDVLWLREALKEAQRAGKTCVVLTHHAPTFHNTSAPKYKRGSLSSSYATDLEYLFNETISVWAHGHTHFSGDQVINKVRVVSNQHGYTNESGSDTGWHNDFYVHIDTNAI